MSSFFVFFKKKQDTDSKMFVPTLSGNSLIPICIMNQNKKVTIDSDKCVKHEGKNPIVR